MSQTKKYIMPVIQFSGFFGAAIYRKQSPEQFVVKKYTTPNAKIRSLESKNE